MSISRSYNLGDLLEIAAAAVPEREAVVFGERRYTFAELDARASRLAAWFAARGIGRGDTVGLHMCNSPECLETFFAACKLGAVPVNVNYRYVAEELRYLYGNARLAALVVDAQFLDEAAAALDAAPGLRALAVVGDGAAARPSIAIDYAAALDEGAKGVREVAPGRDSRRGDDLTLLYTGGTTGMPKGVMWTHEALFFGALGGGGFFSGSGPVAAPGELTARIAEAPPLRCLPIAPLIHGSALWGTLIALFAGQTVILNPGRHFDAAQILDLVVRERVQSITIVGDAMAGPLLDALKAHPGRWDVSGVVSLGSGGAVFSSHLQDGLRAFMPYAYFTNAMGSSESGAIGLGAKPEEGLLRLPARPDVAIVVEGARLAQAGETGILARSGHIPLGYWGDPEKTAATFVQVDGRRFVLLGDRARLEADGSYTMFGRGSTCINTGGEKVYPEEVEEVLKRHEAVADAVVTSVPDSRWTELVTAIVQRRPGSEPSIEALQTHCRGSLAGYKVPKRIVWTERMVRSPAGKADYGWARRYALGQLGG